MIKIRKHAQKKAERERAANGGSGSSRSRETEGKNFHRDQEVSSRSSFSSVHQLIFFTIVAYSIPETVEHLFVSPRRPIPLWHSTLTNQKHS
jgi:hypothetical protein